MEFLDSPPTLPHGFPLFTNICLEQIYRVNTEVFTKEHLVQLPKPPIKDWECYCGHCRGIDVCQPCPACNRLYYCSPKCLEDDKEAHQPLCQQARRMGLLGKVRKTFGREIRRATPEEVDYVQKQLDNDSTSLQRIACQHLPDVVDKPVLPAQFGSSASLTYETMGAIQSIIEEVNVKVAALRQLLEKQTTEEEEKESDIKSKRALREDIIRLQRKATRQKAKPKPVSEFRKFAETVSVLRTLYPKEVGTTRQVCEHAQSLGDVLAHLFHAKEQHDCFQPRERGDYLLQVGMMLDFLWMTRGEQTDQATWLVLEYLWPFPKTLEKLRQRHQTIPRFLHGMDDLTECLQLIMPMEELIFFLLYLRNILARESFIQFTLTHLWQWAPQLACVQTDLPAPRCMIRVSLNPRDPQFLPPHQHNRRSQEEFVAYTRRLLNTPAYVASGLPTQKQDWKNNWNP